MRWVRHVARVGGQKRRVQGFGWERNHLEESERNIKLHYQEVGWAGMEWTALAQDRDRCQALVNAVMNFWVP